MGATSFLLVLRGHWLHLEIPTSSFEDASLLLHYEVVPAAESSGSVVLQKQ